MHLSRLLYWLLLQYLCMLPASATETAWVRQAADGSPQIQLYFFWSATCPHCEDARPYIEALPQTHPWLALQSLELSRHPENTQRYLDLVHTMGGEAAVPAFLFCGEMHVGWQSAQTTGAALEQALANCRQRQQAGEPLATTAMSTAATRIALPWGETIDAAALSLPVLTFLLASLDAFNPCAFFVLLFLLSMLAHQKSRARMLQVGSIFVVFSGFMYFAFMAAWLNIFQLLGQLAWVTLAAGLVALVIGALNIKDFLAFKQGVSLSISETGKQNIFRHARQVMTAEHMPTMLGATVLLAVAANFYELLCTAGFPLVYTRLLTLHESDTLARYGYLALYNLIYVLPLALIVTIFARTLGARKLDERQGRLLKLLSGTMMLELGVLLLVAPDQTSNLPLTAAMIAGALLLTAFAARWTRR